jgi:hypothetical protein
MKFLIKTNSITFPKETSFVIKVFVIFYVINRVTMGNSTILSQNIVEAKSILVNSNYTSTSSLISFQESRGI